MSSLKKRFSWTGILIILVLGLVAAPFAITAVGSESSWVWTKDYPKPEWFDWSEKYWPTKPVSGGYYRSAASRYIGLMNPNHWPVNDWVAMTQLYEMIMYNDGNFRAAIPWLAQSFEFTTPTTVVMKLRPGVKFHDGSDFNAEAFKYQIEWIKNKANGAWSRSWLKPVQSIETLDEYTVKWTFDKPWAAFPGIMANVPGYVISAKALKNDVALLEVKTMGGEVAKLKKKIAKAKGDKLAKAKVKLAELEPKLKAAQAKAKDIVTLDKWAVGTGVNMVEEAKPGNYLKLKRNPNWWFGRSIGKPEMPYFDGWLITIIPDQSVRLANFRAGKLDVHGISPAQYDLIKDDPNITLIQNESNHVTAMRFNMVEGPCKDIRVRKAISHAIDRKAIVVGIQQGLAIEASAMYNSGHWTHNPNLKPVKYDPELSKKLLKEAGYEKGLTVKGYYGNTADSVTRAEAIKAMLEKVGIKWEVEFLDPAASSDKMKNREYDFAGGGWSWIWDPDLMATGLYMPEGGFNFGRTENKAVQALILKGRAEVDVQKRQKIYWEIERLLYENYEDAWLYWPIGTTAYSKNVQGWNNEMYLQGREGTWFSHPMWFKDGGKSQK